VNDPLKSKHLLVHLDVDSPLKLLDFYQIKGVRYDPERLDKFYKTAWARALEFFDRHNIKVTFFVVGDELEKSECIKKIIRDAHNSGHEIENHTYSHPFGLATLPAGSIVDEIKKCNEIVKTITGRTPIGFRSPGYSISTEIINLIDELGFRYDSSGFWSIMNSVLHASHKFLFKGGLKNDGFGRVTRQLPKRPYIPSYTDWLKTSKDRNIMELPLPRTSLFGLPFYHNFNLWAPAIFADTTSRWMSTPCLVYLFHIIEFMDLTDDIPGELAAHPNLKTKVSDKIKASDKIISNLLKRYSHVTTADFVDRLALAY
jgi:peptidoglycan-N-acetylglucosamine deacetylase